LRSNQLTTKHPIHYAKTTPEFYSSSPISKHQVKRTNKVRKRLRSRDLQRNSEEEKGWKISTKNPEAIKKPASRLKTFKNQHLQDMIYIVRGRNSKGTTTAPIVGGRPKIEIIRFKKEILRQKK